jgi:RimJ/RimL family protein N-acetyltransferase
MIDSMSASFHTKVGRRDYRAQFRPAYFVRRFRERVGLKQENEFDAALRSGGPAALEVLRGDESMIPFVMETERMPGFGELVGRWDEARHRAALTDGRHAYFIARNGTGPIGFAIVRDWASPERVALVKRIAVTRPGLGHGRALLSRVVDAVFEETDAWRLWLGVFPENPRARRAYEAVGFRAEGIARGVAFFGSVPRDELVMALLRSEWIALRDRSEPGVS